MTAITGVPGRVSPYFEDPSLPHQIVLLFSHSAGIMVACNCLSARNHVSRGHARQVIGTRTVFPVREAVQAYLEWHHARGIEVSSRATRPAVG